jgi:hypothetical protein
MCRRLGLGLAGSFLFALGADYGSSQGLAIRWGWWPLSAPPARFRRNAHGKSLQRHLSTKSNPSDNRTELHLAPTRGRSLMGTKSCISNISGARAACTQLQLANARDKSLRGRLSDYSNISGLKNAALEVVHGVLDLILGPCSGGNWQLRNRGLRSPAASPAAAGTNRVIHRNIFRPNIARFVRRPALFSGKLAALFSAPVSTQSRFGRRPTLPTASLATNSCFARTHGASVTACHWNLDGLNVRAGQLLHRLLGLDIGKGQRHVTSALAALSSPEIPPSKPHMFVQSTFTSWEP